MSAEREIVTTRVIDAPRERVFAAWTDPEAVVRWWGPDGFTCTIQEMDVRPGGAWRLVLHGPDGIDYPNRSAFVEVVKPERLVYDHISGPKFLATATFADKDGKTEITLRSVFESAAVLAKVIEAFDAVEGAKQTLARLAACVEGER
jgi:uncharacterized protein YndB with AHSA1/START domain